MGNYSDNEISSFSTTSHSLYSNPKEANSPEIHLNENFIHFPQENPNPSNTPNPNLLTQLLNTDLNLTLLTIPKPLTPLSLKRCQKDTNDAFNTTIASENDPNELIYNPNQNSSISHPLINIETEDENNRILIYEIKTMAGSLQKDIRQIYKFKDILGGGHFGKVRTGYRRFEPSPQKLYAIKSLSKQHLSDHAIDELTKEVDIISSLDHPNIVNFYETYHDQFYFHIVMELCNGRDLSERIKKYNGYINEKQTAIVIFKVLNAIAYCHSKGITHRDLKPENIIFESNDNEAEIKLIDFGLSRKYIQNEKMHTILGTPYYIAPEVLKGDYDEKCDIWSIGAIAYTMLCGEQPFKGNSNKEIFQKILKEALKFNGGKWKNVSNEAKDFILKCLNKNPNARPSAAEALLHEWFKIVFPHVHSSLHLSKEILNNIKMNIPGQKLKRIIMKYFVNMMNHSELKKYKNAFFAVDFNHIGRIGQKDLEEAFALGGVEVSKEEMKKIMSCGENNNNMMSYSDFIAACLDKGFLNREKLEIAFQYFDINSSGVIDASDVKDAMLRIGKKLINEEDVYKMIKEVTKKDKSTISFDEFCSMFKVCHNKNEKGGRR